MTIGTMDIFLLVIIVSTLIVGFFWGAARSLMLLGAWLLAFMAGAYLKIDFGSYLAGEWPNLPPLWSEMIAFGTIYVAMLLAAPIIIFVATRTSQRVTRYQMLDDLIGAAFATFVAVLGVAGILIVLATYYGPGDDLVVSSLGGPEWSANLYRSLLASSIGSGINDEVVPLIGAILGPVLPADVREVFG